MVNILKCQTFYSHYFYQNFAFYNTAVVSKLLRIKYFIIYFGMANSVDPGSALSAYSILSETMVVGTLGHLPYSLKWLCRGVSNEYTF